MSPSPDEVRDEVRGRMQRFGFPGSLLPECMTDGDFDEATGRFSVTLARKVQLDVDGIPVHYDRVVSGIIRQGSITDLGGVQAKRGLWVKVGAILADGADLVFKAGPFKKAIPRSAWKD